MNLNKKTNAFVQSEIPYNFIKEIPSKMNRKKKVHQKIEIAFNFTVSTLKKRQKLGDKTDFYRKEI